MSDEAYALLFEKDVAVPMSDGVVLYANVFRPDADGIFPVVMAHGVYGKDTHFADGFASQYQKLLEVYPELASKGTTGKYLRWETADPERWIPYGYVVIQVDSRGTGKSEGFLDPPGPREIQDYYEAIEWAAMQPWSNQRVGLLGISYYGFTQWLVAALQPPHLCAIIPWEALTDFYRDNIYHGGILGDAFPEAWWPGQVTINQHGNGSTRYRDRDTGTPPTGPALHDDMLRSNRIDYLDDLRRHPLADEWHRQRTTDLDRVLVPVLSAGNWGGPGMHLRGNIEGFLRAAAPDKWLSMHIGLHWQSFYEPKYVALQKRFFDHYLKGIDNGWERTAPVQLAIRHADNTATYREEEAFPIPRTNYVRFYLDATEKTMRGIPPQWPATITYDALGDGVDFSSDRFQAETEITGFVTARLFVSSSTSDMDIFATLRLFDVADEEVILVGAHEPTPVARGWLRVSHRKLDATRSRPYRPFHAHDEAPALTAGEVYEVDVEIWPTCIVIPAGFRLVLTVAGKDFEFPGIPGRLLHRDPSDRPRNVFGGQNSLLTGEYTLSYLTLPIIAPSSEDKGRKTNGR